MRTAVSMICTGLLVVCAIGCVSPPDLAHHAFPEARARVRDTMFAIMHDAATGNVDAVRDAHLESNKFTKFGGRSFERMDYQQCVDSETAAFSAARDLRMDPTDMKVDVFGDVAIVTFYNDVSLVLDGERLSRVIRATVAFLNTPEGWKIIHEHVTGKDCFDPPASTP